MPWRSQLYLYLKGGSAGVGSGEGCPLPGMSNFPRASVSVLNPSIPSSTTRRGSHTARQPHGEACGCRACGYRDCGRARFDGFKTETDALGKFDIRRAKRGECRIFPDRHTPRKIVLLAEAPHGEACGARRQAIFRGYGDREKFGTVLG